MEYAEDEPIREVEDEEEEGNEGIGNPQQRGRVPFPHKPTIRKPHKPLNQQSSHRCLCKPTHQEAHGFSL
jgi:hypothetical protein